jgi:hypothetical protein
VPRKVKGYSRVESGDARGWLVRIKRGDERKSRFISDSTHGGKRKAMLVAQQVYEEWVAEMPAPETSAGKIGKRNSSGVVGVHYSHDVDERYPGCEYESYVASWLDEDGRRKNMRFSCHKYGDDAFELACLAREKKLADRDKVVALFSRRQKSKPKKSAKSKPAKKTPAQKTTAKSKPAKKTTVKKKTAKKTIAKHR